MAAVSPSNILDFHFTTAPGYAKWIGPKADYYKNMWVSKPIYESLPYFYLLAGGLFLAASMYLNYSYWPTVCFTVGLICLVAGMVVLLKRRDYRMTDQRARRADY